MSQQFLNLVIAYPVMFFVVEYRNKHIDVRESSPRSTWTTLSSRCAVPPSRSQTRKALRSPPPGTTRSRSPRRSRSLRRSATEPSSTTGAAPARRQGVQGLHVHVGMPRATTATSARGDPARGSRSCSRSRRTRRASPGEDGAVRTARPSSRSCRAPARRRRSGPTSGWDSLVERLTRLGVMQDDTRIWWDIRPHPRFGTLEVRMPDQPTDARVTAAFVGLLQTLRRASPTASGAVPTRPTRRLPRRTAGRPRASARPPS